MNLAEDIWDEGMTRGRRKHDRDGPERRCIATGESGPTDRLMRFVLGPDGSVVPDVAGKLPGRGVWLTADRELVDLAVLKRLFSRAFRQSVEVAPDLSDQLEGLLARRLIETLSLARKAGQAVTGSEKVRARIKDGAAVLLQASDGAADGKAKLAALADAVGSGAVARIQALTAQELGLAFGREFAIHAALDPGGFAHRVCAEAMRLSGFRDVPGQIGTIEDQPAFGAIVEDWRVSGNTENESALNGASDKDDT